MRVANRLLTDRIVGDAIAELALPEAIELCEAARIAYGQVNDVGMLEHHPQLKARHRWTEMDSPVGRIASMLPPIVVHGQQQAVGSVPAVGEHVEPILLELGYSEDHIRTLRAGGVV